MQFVIQERWYVYWPCEMYISRAK